MQQRSLIKHYVHKLSETPSIRQRGGRGDESTSDRHESALGRHVHNDETSGVSTYIDNDSRSRLIMFFRNDLERARVVAKNARSKLQTSILSLAGDHSIPHYVNGGGGTLYCTLLLLTC